MSKILDYLYLGDAMTARDLKALKLMKITHILNVASEIDPYFEKQFIYKHIKIEDRDDFEINQQFDEISDYIYQAHQSQGIVYVHCAFGISRSPTAVMAYLIKYLKYGHRKAKHFVENLREEVCPNDGFLKQLEQYDHDLKNQKKVSSSKEKEASENDQLKNKKEDQNKQGQKANDEEFKAENQSNQDKSLDTKTIEKENQEQRLQYYSCKYCRLQLFNEKDIKHFKNGDKKKCTSIFIDKVKWISTDDLAENERKLCCPKCLNKLGEQVLSGKICSCGEWVAPAFQILETKVDLVKTINIKKINK